MIKNNQRKWLYYGVLRVAEAALVVLLVYVIVSVSSQIERVRRTVAEQSIRLEANLVLAVEHGVLQSELERRSHDLDRLSRMVPEQVEIDGVVAELERDAGNRNLEIRIPKVANNMELDQRGREVEQMGPYREVKMIVVVQGKEKDVMNFWHAAENLPYLTGVIGFDLRAEGKKILTSSLTRGPGKENVEEEQGLPEASLSLELLVSTKADDNNNEL